MQNPKKFSDSNLSQVEEDKYLNQIFTKHYDKKLKEKYASKLENEYGVSKNSQKTKSSKSFVYKFLPFAGAIAAGIIAFVIFGGSPNDDLLSMSEQYMHSEILKNKTVTRGDINTDLIRNAAISAYNEGNMKEAQAKYLQIENKSDEDHFFLGLSYMYDKEHKKALSQFQNIKADNFKFGPELNWYTALSLIQDGQHDLAKQKLTNVSNWKKAEAKKLINAME